MPRNFRCSFCGVEFLSGKGMMYVRNDGTIFRFCSRKCRRSHTFRRDPRKFKWTQRYVKPQ